MRKKKMRKRNSRRPIAVIAAVLLIGTGIGLMFSPVFQVKEVLCEGNDKITREEIMEAAQVSVGGNLFMQRIAKIKRHVLDIPMTEEVQVNRVFPDKIRISVTERVPAGYISQDGTLYCVDVSGQIVDQIADERVAAALAAYTPKKVEVLKDDQEDGTKTKDTKSVSDETEDDETETVEDETPTKEKEDAEDTEKDTEEKTDESEKADETVQTLPYAVPIVVGLTLEKPQAGKAMDSKEREKLDRVKEWFEALEKTELLNRATYIDVTNIGDVLLVLENRLQVQLGSLHDTEYRMRFLAKVVKERIGASEEAVMDYRGEDIYVRPPEDGKARVKKSEKVEKVEKEQEKGENTKETEKTSHAEKTEKTNADRSVSARDEDEE